MYEREREEPRRERTRPSNAKERPYAWRRQTLFIWEGEGSRRVEPSAVELSYRDDQGRILWSHTPGRMVDDEFMPTMHLSDLDLRAYVALLEAAGRAVSKLRATGEAPPQRVALGRGTK